MTQPLWQPSQKRIVSSRLFQFMRSLEEKSLGSFPDFLALQDWSLKNPAYFWESVWEFCDIQGERGQQTISLGKNFWETRFFPEARLNFAQNLLRQRDATPALVFWGEDRVQKTITFEELGEQVDHLSAFLETLGLKAKDRVAAILPNIPETIVAFLATVRLGAIWSSCSPDFGLSGLLDRLTQIQPKVLFFGDGYFYHGKTIDCMEKLAPLLAALPCVEQVILVSYVNSPKNTKTLLWHDALEEGKKQKIPPYLLFPFNHPLCILFSSGTTGVPKGIIHSAGGTLLEHLKEHQLHCDIHPRDRVFYFTTCGWMMWNWLVTALASKATLFLYDGSPFCREGRILFDFAQEAQMTFFGTSAKFLEVCQKEKLSPIKTHNLSSVRTIASTGSPLSAEAFEYVYQHIASAICLSSISGGTDIVACFLLGNPIGSVWPGELQAPSLGYAIDVFDEKGNPLQEQKGELVCTSPFPSMPLGFLKDPGDKKFRAAYFERFPGVWHHGDFVATTPHGGMIIYGRSDTTLNPGGVRIGTAEIYRQVEKIEEVLESIAVGQDWEGDVRIILFVKLREGAVLDNALEQKIKDQIRSQTTRHHVPTKIVSVLDIPHTKNGKMTEIAVHQAINGQPIQNTAALANPEALEVFKNFFFQRDLGV